MVLLKDEKWPTDTLLIPEVLADNANAPKAVLALPVVLTANA